MDPAAEVAHAPRVPPDALSARLASAARLVTDELGAAPAAVVALAAPGRVVGPACAAAGSLFGTGAPPPCEEDTPFDLASVTKPFTALAAARLVRAGLVAWETPLGALVDEARGTPSASATLELLLSHRAGLDGHRPLFRPLTEGRAVDRAAALREAADARRPGCEGEPPAEGFPALYSDLGYLLAGEALSRAAGEPLDALVTREVCAPLGLGVGSARALRARPGGAAGGFDERVAPTEVVAFRGGVVRGAVHDENAWAMSGDAASGHAGLFGIAADVARLGVALLEALGGARAAWLTAAEVGHLVARRPGGSHVLGFDRRSGDAPSSGARFGPETFGHLGFTGTSLWVDPEAAIVGVLLTNRVHPTREHVAIRAARPRVYDALWEAAARA